MNSIFSFNFCCENDQSVMAVKYRTGAVPLTDDD